MAQLVFFKETLIYFYKKHADVLFPMFKFIFSLLSLCIVSNMFQYNDAVNKMLIFLPVSAVQAFLPWSFLYFTTLLYIYTKNDFCIKSRFLNLQYCISINRHIFGKNQI